MSRVYAIPRTPITILGPYRSTSHSVYVYAILRCGRLRNPVETPARGQQVSHLMAVVIMVDGFCNLSCQKRFHFRFLNAVAGVVGFLARERNK